MGASDDPSAPLTSGKNDDFGQGIIIIVLIPAILSYIIVALRFAVRAWIVKSLGWDDYTMMFATIGLIIGPAFVLVEVHYGFGRHYQYLTPHQLLEFQKYTFGEWIQTFATLMWTKVSICLFLLRIPFTKYLIRPLQAALAVLVVSNVVLTVLWIVQCQPVHKAWDKTVEGKCWDKSVLRKIIFSQAIISVVSDFSFAAYPILILWSVQLKWQTKAALCGLMGLGVITGACCIVRTVLNDASIPDKDVSYGGIINWIWRTFEVHIGIIAACIPTLLPGVRWIREKVRPTKGTSSIHLPLADSPNHQFRAGGGGMKPSLPLGLSGTTAKGDALSGSDIVKTTRIDVEPGLFV